MVESIAGQSGSRGSGCGRSSPILAAAPHQGGPAQSVYRCALDDRRRIDLHPRFAQGSPADPHALSLVIHEVRHLRQGPSIALSVYGELEAWQLQFGFLKSLTGHYHSDPQPNHMLGELVALALNWERPVLQQARRLMQAYAGKAYRIDLLPLYPLPAEIMFRISGKRPGIRQIYNG